MKKIIASVIALYILFFMNVGFADNHTFIPPKSGKYSVTLTFNAEEKHTFADLHISDHPNYGHYQVSGTFSEDPKKILEKYINQCHEIGNFSNNITGDVNTKEVVGAYQVFLKVGGASLYSTSGYFGKGGPIEVVGCENKLKVKLTPVN